MSALSSSAIVCVAVDLDLSGIWFRVDDGPWNGSGLADPASNIGGIGISALTDGVVLAVTNGPGNDLFTVDLNSGASAFTYDVPGGFTSGWPVNEFSDYLGATKVAANVLLGPPDLFLSKLDATAVIGPPNLSARKVAAHALRGAPNLSLRKLTVHVFRQPFIPSPPRRRRPKPRGFAAILCTETLRCHYTAPASSLGRSTNVRKPASWSPRSSSGDSACAPPAGRVATATTRKPLTESLSGNSTVAFPDASSGTCGFQ